MSLTSTNTSVDVNALYAPIRSDLDAARKVFDDELVSDLFFVNELCDQIRSYRGKMLRPAMLLLSGKAVGDLTADHHVLAAVVEMVHMATLVHDDVLDDADQRRKQPTIRSTDGNVSAILLGDYLISHAYHLCSSVGETYAGRRIGDATNTVCEGELLQNKCRRDDGITEATYLDIVRRKTGALTAVSCELGAFFAGADRATTEALHGYGMAAGVAFQIIDDVLDITGDAQQVGKTLGLDLAMGKLTLPTLHGLANATPAVASALRAALRGQQGVDAEQLRDWLEECGSIDFARAVASGFVAQAAGFLDVLPPGDAKSSLTMMVEFIIQRRD